MALQNPNFKLNVQLLNMHNVCYGIAIVFVTERIIQVQSFFYTEPISLNEAHSTK